MSKKRNKMSAIMTLKAQYENYPGKDVCNIFKEGWDAAIEHDERVLALVEVIKAVIELGKHLKPNGFANLINDLELALAQYQGSMKK